MGKFTQHIVRVRNKDGAELMRMTLTFERFERLKEYCAERGLTYEILATV